MQTHPIERGAVEAAVGQGTGNAARAHGLALNIETVDKSYTGRKVLDQLSLSIAPGEFVAIVGRSGCGKSTLLRLVAGLEEADSGAIRADNIPTRGLNPDMRIMFQDARLLPWRHVLPNVALGLPKEARAQALEALRQVGLEQRAGDWPAVLSGGQRQRVALARALVHEPRLLLLDEPLGALDALTRIEMHQLIENLWLKRRFTALLVTHDVGEAVALADRVVLIEDGRIALDQRVDLPRPRERGSAAFAALEEKILRQVLKQPAREPDALPVTEVLPFRPQNWAV
jgi:sulfonate transport system ATP-binding protein